MIKSYFNKKLKYHLFDKIIRAYKINGKIVEKSRTTHGKSHIDFLNVTNFPSTTQICFIDDQYHPKMINDNIMYIFINPYIYNLDYETMSKKYFKQNTELFKKFNKTENDFISYMAKLSNHNLENLNKTPVEKNIDLLISEKIENNIKKFLKDKPTFTKKNKKIFKNQTRKN